MFPLVLIACQSETELGPSAPVPDAPAPIAPAPVVEDRDADGFAAEVDCDDEDPRVFPGALERCNGIDDACDRGTDDGAVSVVGGDAWPSLRTAIEQAPEGAEITVCPGSWDGPIAITRPLVIASSHGPEVTILDGQRKTRVLAIHSDGVEVRGFTITNGTAVMEDGGGGGVYVAPFVDATLADVVLTGNATDGSGGSLLLDRESAVVLDGTITRSSAFEGGGAYLRAGATLTGGEITGNDAALGGGLALEDGAWVELTRVIGNTAAVGGGGVLSTGADVHLVDVEIAANSSAWQGGGISVLSGELFLDGATLVTANVATRAGGGLEVFGGAVRGGLVLANLAERLGGGVYVGEGRVIDATISQNSAELGGGVATESGRVALEGVLVTDNDGRLGGGLYVDGSTLVAEATVTSNAAQNGGGIFVGPAGVLTVRDSDLGVGPDDNAPDDVATEEGAGVAVGADAFACDSYGCN